MDDGGRLRSIVSKALMSPQSICCAVDNFVKKF